MSGTELLHSSCVANDGRAVLIAGPSGSGKSDLALRLIDRGFALVSDDQTLVRNHDGTLIASAPITIAGKIEVRGIGIIDMPAVGDVPVALLVELAQEIERLPEDGRDRFVAGASLPVVEIDPSSPSAPIKVALALDRLGRR